MTLIFHSHILLQPSQIEYLQPLTPLFSQSLKLQFFKSVPSFCLLVDFHSNNTYYLELENGFQDHRNYITRAKQILKWGSYACESS